MKRKIISALLALCMVLSMVPFAGATDAETPSGGGPVKLDKAPEILPATLGDTANVVPQEELMNGYDVTFVGGAGTKADPYLYNMEHPGLRAHANAQQPAVVDYWVGIFLPIEIDKQLENGSQGGSCMSDKYMYYRGSAADKLYQIEGGMAAAYIWTIDKKPYYRMYFKLSPDVLKDTKELWCAIEDKNYNTTNGWNTDSNHYTSPTNAEDCAWIKIQLLPSVKIKNDLVEEKTGFTYNKNQVPTGVSGITSNQTMMFTFEDALPNGLDMWFDITAPDGAKYGASMTGDSTTKVKNVSFLNKSDFAVWPADAKTGMQVGEYQVDIYITSTPAQQAEGDAKAPDLAKAKLLHSVSINATPGLTTLSGVNKPVVPQHTLGYTAIADKTVVSDCMDQTMYVRFADKLPADTYMWFKMTGPDGKTYGIGANSAADGQTASYAWSFMNPGQFEYSGDLPKGDHPLYSNDQNLGSGLTNNQDGLYTVEAYLCATKPTGTFQSADAPAGSIKLWEDTVEVKNTVAPVTPAKPSVEVGSGVPQADVAKVTEAAESLEDTSGTMKDLVEQSDLPETAAGSVDMDKAVAELNKLTGVSGATAENTRVVIVPRMNVAVTEYSTTGDEKKLVMDVTATADIVVTKKSTTVDAIETSGASQNAVVMSTKPLTVNKPITLTLTLPVGFAAGKETTDPIFVKRAGDQNVLTAEIIKKDTSPTPTPAPTADPEATPAPDETPAPDTTPAPSQDPDATGAPDATAAPEASVKPTESPAASEKPATSPEPAESTAPSTAPSPAPSTASVPVKQAAPSPDTGAKVRFTSPNGLGVFTFLTEDNTSVAEVNGQRFTNLQDAYNAVEENGVITLLKDCDQDITNVTKSFKIKITTPGKQFKGNVIPNSYYNCVVSIDVMDNTLGQNESYMIYTLTRKPSIPGPGGPGGSTGPGGTDPTPTPGPSTSPDPSASPEPSTSPDPSASPDVKFDDVKAKDWFYDAVQYVVQNGLMAGVGGNSFKPNDLLTRAMMAQILYNKAGKPAVTGKPSFTDVPNWAADAVKWAADNKVTEGIGGGKFGSDRHITREELAVMLWRDAGKPAPAGTAINFPDAGKISSWAQTAMKWAVQNKILNGNDKGMLEPQGKASRAVVAQMLMNYLKK